MSCTTTLTQEHVSILQHTIKNGLFCGGGKEMNDLCAAGLMQLAGKKSFVPDPYYRITELGKLAQEKKQCSRCKKFKRVDELNGYCPIENDYSNAYCRRLVECDSKEADEMFLELIGDLS